MLKKESKRAIVIVIVICALFFGVILSETFAGIVGFLIFLMASIIFFMMSKESYDELKILKQFIKSGKIDEGKFKRLKALCKVME